MDFQELSEWNSEQYGGGQGAGENGNMMPITCGIGKRSRIVGGTIAAPGAWPWQVGFKKMGVDWQGTWWTSVYCGGSLINRCACANMCM